MVGGGYVVARVSCFVNTEIINQRASGGVILRWGQIVNLQRAVGLGVFRTSFEHAPWRPGSGHISEVPDPARLTIALQPFLRGGEVVSLRPLNLTVQFNHPTG